MRKCPDCGKWTLEFDDYFGRFRCFNAECGWMPSSSAEREIRLLHSQERPTLLVEKEIPDLGLKFTAAYDLPNDALVFDFGLEEPGFDLPEGDGRMIWQIGSLTGSVVGFTILGARRFGVSQVRIDLAARKETIEQSVRMAPGVIASGRPTRILIEAVQVMAQSQAEKVPRPDSEVSAAFKEAIHKCSEHFAESAAAT